MEFGNDIRKAVSRNHFGQLAIASFVTGVGAGIAAVGAVEYKLQVKIGDVTVLNHDPANGYAAPAIGFGLVAVTGVLATPYLLGRAQRLDTERNTQAELADQPEQVVQVSPPEDPNQL